MGLSFFLYPSGLLYCKQFLDNTCGIALKWCCCGCILQEAGLYVHCWSSTLHFLK